MSYNNSQQTRKTGSTSKRKNKPKSAQIYSYLNEPTSISALEKQLREEEQLKKEAEEGSGGIGYSSVPAPQKVKLIKGKTDQAKIGYSDKQDLKSTPKKHQSGPSKNQLNQQYNS